jgi:hypothetical protein
VVKWTFSKKCKYVFRKTTLTLVFSLMMNIIKVFCSRASPLYFSFDRMLLMVVWPHLVPPAGVGIRFTLNSGVEVKA